MKQFKLIKIEADSPYKRGLQYGTEAKKEIGVCLETYKERFKTGRNLEWDQVLEYAAGHIPYAEKQTPDMLEEAKGIADGSGHFLNEIMLLNTRYEILHYPNQKECTAFALERAATAEHKVIIGQNWDQRPNLLEHTLLLDITEQETGIRIFGMTEAGQLIRNGFNSLGIGLCSNSIHSALDHKGFGLPSNFLRRKILTMGKMQDVVKAIREAERTVSNNFCVASRDENVVVDLEGIPVTAIRYDSIGGIITHANNLLVNRDLDTYKDERFRAERLYELLSLRRGKIDIDYIKLCLKDHFNMPEAICSHLSEKNKLWQTDASIIYDLDDQKAFICYGPPCEGEYVEYSI